MKQLTNIILLLVSSFSISQEMQCKTINDFDVIDFPSNEYLSDLNGSTSDWLVIKKNNQVVFCDDYEIEYAGDSLSFSLDSIKFDRKDHIRLSGKHHYLKIRNGGWLIGTNKGEWGGSLIWISKDLNSYKHLGSANVNQLFYWNEEIYVLEGLSHLSISGGNLFKIGSDLSIDTVATFDETPYAAEIESDSIFYVLTDSKLLQIDQAYKQEVLFSNEEWPYLYPSSLVLNENKLYIAMRGGIGYFNLESRIMRWMKIKAHNRVDGSAR